MTWAATIGAALGLLVGVLATLDFAPQRPQTTSPPDRTLAVDGHTITNVPEGYTVHYRSEQHATGGQTTETASAQSASAKSNSGDITSKMKLGAPTTSLHGNTAGGGGGEVALTLEGKNGSNVFFILAAILLIASIVGFAMKLYKPAIWCAVGCGTCVGIGVAVTEYPAAVAGIFLLAAAGVAIWYWAEHGKSTTAVAVKSMIDGEKKALANGVISLEQHAAIKSATADAVAAAPASTSAVNKVIDKAKTT